MPRATVSRTSPRVIGLSQATIPLILQRTRNVFLGRTDEVSLVIVGTVEGGAPVVHRVEEHVVKDDPATLADDPAVVHDPLVPGRDRFVALRRGGGRAARNPATEEQ